MPTRTISAKELRLNMTKVWKAVEHGESFTVMLRSKPIADITPPQQKTLSREKAWDFWINPPKEFRFKSKKSAVETIRELRDE
ncbi:MAG: hypothetical protein AB1352_02010 [Patescibacteria group bacterium]